MYMDGKMKFRSPLSRSKIKLSRNLCYIVFSAAKWNKHESNKSMPVEHENGLVWLFVLGLGVYWVRYCYVRHGPISYYYVVCALFFFYALSHSPSPSSLMLRNGNK